MTALVTGATGFLGSRTAAALCDRGEQVRVLVRPTSNRRRLEGLLAAARAALGAFVGAPPDDLTFVPNAGTGVNMAARALELTPQLEENLTATIHATERDLVDNRALLSVFTRNAGRLGFNGFG